ncbi:hypothetical protein J6590_074206 [Homalodisca vitripennis]|nr:hypothetical protein J6590_074206 [Homalodisca vitripennis]
MMDVPSDLFVPLNIITPNRHHCCYYCCWNHPAKELLNTTFYCVLSFHPPIERRGVVRGRGCVSGSLTGFETVAAYADVHTMDGRTRRHGSVTWPMVFCVAFGCSNSTDKKKNISADQDGRHRLASLKQNSHSILFCLRCLISEVNCCILPDTHNPTSQRYLGVLYGAGYVCGINVHTRVTTNTNDVNNSSELFVRQIQTILKNSTEDKHIPTKEMKIKPWMTRELTNLIKTAKEDYFRNNIKVNKNNAKFLWKSISEITGNTKRKEAFKIDPFLEGNREPNKSDVIKVADTFNDYYVNVGAGLASAVPPVTELVDDGDFAVDSALRLVLLTHDDIFRSVTEIRGLRPGD